MVYSIRNANCNTLSVDSLRAKSFECTDLVALSSNSETADYNHHHKIYFQGPLVVFEYRQEAMIESISTTSGTKEWTLTFDALAEPRVAAGNKITLMLVGKLRTVDTELNGIPIDEIMNTPFEITIPNNSAGGLGVANVGVPSTTAADTSGDVPNVSTDLYDDVRIVFTRRKYLNMSLHDSEITDIYEEIDLSTMSNMHP